MAALAFALALVLASCGGAPERKEVTPAPVGPVVPEAVEEQGLPDSEFADTFAAAEQALLAFDWMSAEALLATLPDAGLTDTDSTYRQYLRARILWQRGDREAAEAAVEAAPTVSNRALNGKLQNFQRHRLELEGEYLASARLAATMSADAPTPEAEAALRRLIWLNLQRLPDASLAPPPGTDPDWNGWLELARISREESRLETALLTWLAANPQHPAANPMPGGLSLLLQEEPPPPARVALLLPLSGRLAPAGRAVRDGYLAAFYAAAARGAVPELAVYDRLTFASATAAYQQAVSDGAELVVGPLSRSAVEELGRNPARPVPMLALNRAERPLNQAGSALVQISLSAEDEARQLATAAFGDGKRRAVLLRPAGSWGEKMEQAMRDRWQQMGGTLAAASVYASAEQYSDAITGALALSASEARARQLRTDLNLPLEFTARRRADIDAVFLLSRTPAEARALKPLLQFYYAGDLPVYATSSVYSGIPSSADRDLDGIRVAEMPWLLGSNPGARVAIAAGGTGSDAYTRLNALGADAFRVQQRFRQLRAGPDALIRGDTGLLTMNPQLQLLRETRMATFEGGELQPR